ncbi:MAG TPA: MFS transporter, partial [Elusimicrobiota bacterium]|nr:MFS transporter [Elusimicrobiota bacterium]
MQVSVPLALLELSDSMSLTALATGGATFLDAVGTLAGAWLTERYGNRRVLTASTLVRAASLGTAAALSLAGVLTVPVLVAAVLVEGLARGVADTAQSTVPQSIARGDADALRHIYRRYHGTVEFGAIVGPLLVGTLILAAGMGWAAALAPAAFLVAATIYRRLPSDTQTEHGPEAPEKLGFKGALSIPWVRLALLATAFLTLYPLKGLLPAIFAEEALHSPPAAAWLAVLFGVGGFAGSYVSVHAWKRLGLGPLLALAALGSVILGLAWLPGAFLPAAVGVLLFSASNVVARVALSSELVTRYGASAPTVMGLTRFTVNASAIVVRMAVALAFALTASVMGGFTALAVGIAVVAAGLLWVGLRLSRR